MKTLMIYVATVVALISSTTVLANTSPTIQVENTNHKVKFLNLSFDEIDKGTVITGKVTKSTYNSRVAPGHIDYAIYDKRGKLIDEGAVQYSPSMMLRRWKYGSSFAFKIPDDLPADAVVKVSYHRNQGKIRLVSPTAQHDVNVLTE